MSERLRHWMDVGGSAVLRWSLVLFFVAFGLLKFTPEEARTIAPHVEHSPLLSWLAAAFGVQGASNVIGVIEIAMGLAIALRRLSPLVSGYGSLATAGALLVTISFLITTPGVTGDPWQSGFLAKDLTLFGAALWSAAEAFAAARERRDRPLATVAAQR